MAWAVYGTPETLSSPSSTITISDLTPRTFVVVLQHLFRTGAGLAPDASRLGNGSVDATASYTTRYSNNGGADQSNLNQTSCIDYTPSFSGETSFSIVFLINRASDEKLFMKFRVGSSTAGAATAPSRSLNYNKWVNTSNQTDHYQSNRTVDAANFDTDSNMSALGTD